MNIAIREANHNDKEALERIQLAANVTLRKTYRPIAGKESLIPATPVDLKFVVALVDNNIAGACGYAVDGDIMWTERMGILDEYRRHGVARAIFSYLSNVAMKQGASRIRGHIVVQTGNVNIWRKMGFEVIRESPSLAYESDVFSELSEAIVELRIGGKSK